MLRRGFGAAPVDVIGVKLPQFWIADALLLLLELLGNLFWTWLVF